MAKGGEAVAGVHVCGSTGTHLCTRRDRGKAADDIRSQHWGKKAGAMQISSALRVRLVEKLKA